MHTRAERSGIIREMVRGRASLFGYGLFLRNLLPAYMQLERGLRRCRRMSGVGRLALPEVYRAGALVADLEALFGLTWHRRLPLLPAGDRYARQVAAADQGEAPGLIGHAYTRYLGDLSGGQILKGLLARSLALSPRALNFYDFPGIDDMKGFKSEYRRAIGLAAREVAELDAVLDAADQAFRLNIEVSDAVQRVAAVEGAGDLLPVRPGCSI